MDSVVLFPLRAVPAAFFAANLTWMDGLRQFESPDTSRA